MRWVYPKHVPEFAKFKEEDRVHFKWLQYDADLNILIANMRDNAEERVAVREFFVENRYKMKVITEEDNAPPHLGGAFPRFFPWEDPFRELYLHYGHLVEPERPVAARAPELSSPSKRRRVLSPLFLRINFAAITSVSFLRRAPSARTPRRPRLPPPNPSRLRPPPPRPTVSPIVCRCGSCSARAPRSSGAMWVRPSSRSSAPPTVRRSYTPTR